METAGIYFHGGASDERLETEPSNETPASACELLIAGNLVFLGLYYRDC
jgi:hypothetical protein